MASSYWNADTSNGRGRILWERQTQDDGDAENAESRIRGILMLPATDPVTGQSNVNKVWRDAWGHWYTTTEVCQLVRTVFGLDWKPSEVEEDISVGGELNVFRLLMFWHSATD